MSGIEGFNFPAFAEAASELRRRGYDVVNPAEGTVDFSRPWSYYMRRAIRMLTECDAIALLEGWEQSRGARLEVYVGRHLDIPATPVADMINGDAV